MLEGKLVAGNLFEVVNAKRGDRVVFYYRGGLKKDLKLLDLYKELGKKIQEELKEKVWFYHYDIEKN